LAPLSASDQFDLRRNTVRACSVANEPNSDMV
jgi:hypothetical protein